MSNVSPCLWFNGEAEEAANFYVSLLPNSRIERIQRNIIDGPAGRADTVLLVDFTLAGQRYMALNGGMKRLSNPPHRVADEVDPDLGIVLICRAHETGIRLADQIAQRYAAILILLGHGEREPEVRANQFRPCRFTGVVILRAPHGARKFLLLLGVQYRLAAQLSNIKVE